MAKKDKGNSSARRQQANAPEYHQISQSADLFQQPPHNPYYPNPAASILPPASAPPPPYSAALNPSSAARTPAIPMAYVNDISYPRLQPTGVSTNVQASVIYDHRAERYKRKVRSFNSQTIIISMLSIILAIWAYNLYSQRNCIEQFVVHKINPQVELKISDVRQNHMNIVYGSALIIVICVLKVAIGFGGKSHCCYLFIIAILSFFMLVHTGYLTYLAYYSPCVASFTELANQAGKSILSKLVNSLPPPDKGVFGESNVVAMAPQDNYGFAIFVMDALNAIFYLSIFVSSILLC